MSALSGLLLLIVLGGAVPVTDVESTPPPCVFEDEYATLTPQHEGPPPMDGPVSDCLGVSVDIEGPPKRPGPRPGVTVECAPAPELEGLMLGCQAAVSAAIATLDPDHPPIARVSFDYGPCQDVFYRVEGDPSTTMALDCAIHMMGTVTIEFVGADPIAIHVEYASGGGAVAVP